MNELQLASSGHGTIKNEEFQRKPAPTLYKMSEVKRRYLSNNTLSLIISCLVSFALLPS